MAAFPRLGAGLALASVALLGCIDDALKSSSVPVSIVTPDSAVLHSLGQLLPIRFQVLNEMGHEVRGMRPRATVSDTSVVTIGTGTPTDSSVTLLSHRNGVATLTLELGALRREVGLRVEQVADSLEVTWPDTLPIRSAPRLAPLPLQCVARDRNGYLIAGSPAVQSAHGMVGGSDCAGLVAIHSGFDTLMVRSGPVLAQVPLILALRAEVVLPLGQPVPVDSLPAGLTPWAPTLIRNSQGGLDLYFSGNSFDSTAPMRVRGNLLRVVSTDGGGSFQYDGVALGRDSAPCSPNGDGIENVAVLPRSDARGWRMYYASGGFTCYGWQVFSAVASDERQWVKEPGVRISNGGTVPPAAPVSAPWPSGEGMQVEQLPSGEWRMIAGTYENITPREDKFQITEWRSADQLTWSYHGVVLTTTAVGPEAERSIYSPTIREFTPGLFRMIFTGDNLNQPGGRSRLYSAVSVDKTAWQVEGVFMASLNADLYYSSLVDDLLVFIRHDIGQPLFLAITSVSMP